MTDPRRGERVELFKGDNGQWYFHRIAANNEKVSSSEGYKHFGDAEGEARKIFPDVSFYVMGRGGFYSYWPSEAEAE